MNRTYDEWLKYYENATKEQVIEDMMLDINSIKEKNKEIERLNNIINELEKYLIDKQELTCGCGITRDYLYAYENVSDKLKELKEKSNIE